MPDSTHQPDLTILSEREREAIVAYLRFGREHGAKAISRSAKTLDSHLESARKKLKLEHRWQLRNIAAMML